MNAEHTKYLYETFPNLYQDHKKSMRETCMCWGFECGDGWFELIKELSEKLEPTGVVAVQVKEKFGTLRFYIESAPVDVADDVWAWIDDAESRSGSICEECGAPGKMNDGPWYSVRCDDCRGVAQSG